MPATRRPRTSSGPVPKGGQKSLSFTPSKITKPASSTKKSPSSSSLTPQDLSPDAAAPATTTIPPSSLGHTTSSPAVAAQAAAALTRKDTATAIPPESRRAAGEVSDAQIRAYWRAREAERRSPRVHLEDVPVEERILRLWDMSSQFGPAIGIARVKRWTRAQRLGLNPPIEVLAVLLREEEKMTEGKGKGKDGGKEGVTTAAAAPRFEKAYVDELLGSIAVAGEV